MPQIPFGPYTLVRRLAVGGMAEVYLATLAGPRGFEKKVVVKQILPQLAREPELLQLFFDEAAIAQKLVHPGIVQVFDVGQHDGTHYIAMEWVDGLDLDELIRREVRATGHGIPVPLALRVVLDLARAVHYAHEAIDEDGTALDVIHRDISPQNVLLGRDGAVKLGDFGIARTNLRARHTQTGVLRGKISYLAPERFAGERASRGVDVYAMGVVLFECVAGRRPFTGDDAQLIKKILHEPPPRLSSVMPDVDPRLDALVAAAMARRLEDRLPSAKALVDGLVALGAAAALAELGTYVSRLADRNAVTPDDAAVPVRISVPPVKRSTETLPGRLDDHPELRRASLEVVEAVDPIAAMEREDSFATSQDTAIASAVAVPVRMMVGAPGSSSPPAAGFVDPGAGAARWAVVPGLAMETATSAAVPMPSGSARSGPPPVPPVTVSGPPPAELSPVSTLVGWPSAIVSMEPTRALPVEEVVDDTRIASAVPLPVLADPPAWTVARLIAVARRHPVRVVAAVCGAGVIVGWIGTHALLGAPEPEVGTAAATPMPSRAAAAPSPARAPVRTAPVELAAEAVLPEGDAEDLTPTGSAAGAPRPEPEAPDTTATAAGEEPRRVPRRPRRARARATDGRAVAGEEGTRSRAPVTEEAPRSRTATGEGELSIDADPWAYVIVDGRSLGATPLAHVRMPAGTHRVRLENPELNQARMVSVTIRDQQRTAVRVRMSDGVTLR